jgi:hypothetical protein
MKAGLKLSSRGFWGLAILLLGLAGLSAAAAAPFLWRPALAVRLDDGQRLMQLIESKLAQAEANRKPLLVTAANAGEAYVTGETAGLATASLQRIMVDLANANDMRVEKVQPLPADAKDGLARLRLEIETTGSLESLRGYLMAIETGTPLLFVKEAHVTTSASPGGDSSQLPSEALTVSLQVEAYSWWGAAP